MANTINPISFTTIARLTLPKRQICLTAVNRAILHVNRVYNIVTLNVKIYIFTLKGKLV